MEPIEQRIILIDADIVSHFVTAGQGFAINKIFTCPIHILDKVHAELQKWPSTTLRAEISTLLSKKVIKLVTFPEEDEVIKKEYLWIKAMMFKGDGESACLAFARYNKRILASSNLRDTKSYCEMHKIDYLTTMDFLCRALSTGFYTEAECDSFISKVLNAKSKLPVKRMADFNCRKILFT